MIVGIFGLDSVKGKELNGKIGQIVGNLRSVEREFTTMSIDKNNGGSKIDEQSEKIPFANSTGRKKVVRVAE